MTLVSIVKMQQEKNMRIKAVIMLRNYYESSFFTDEEIQQICHCISVHSNKQNHNDGALCELLKDADVFQRFLYDPSTLFRNKSSITCGFDTKRVKTE